MDFEHPGLAYIAKCGEPADEADVLRYADFLRQEAGLGHGPLASLEAIYERFGMPRPARARLTVGRGFVLNPDTGHIVIAEDDLTSVQRFTEGHELFEFLFDVLSPGSPSAHRLRARKEALCDAGSACLLMDAQSFAARIHQLGVSLGSARQLAIEYRVSLTAALRRLVELAPGRHAMVIWSLADVPGASAAKLLNCRARASERRLRRLRIDWARRSDGTFVPRNQAVSVDTSVYRAYEMGVTTNGHDQLPLVGLGGDCRCENKPVTAGSQRRVLSLIHLPDDAGCEPDRYEKSIGDPENGTGARRPTAAA
jgi:hypothetical protein